MGRPLPLTLLLYASLAAGSVWAQDAEDAEDTEASEADGSELGLTITKPPQSLGEAAGDEPELGLPVTLPPGAVPPRQPVDEDLHEDLDGDGEPEEDERALDGFEPIGDEVEPEGPYHQPLRGWIAGELAACLPFGELDPGARAGLGLGLQLPWLGGRLLPGVELGYTGASSTGSLNDERLPEGSPYTWDLSLRQIEAGGGLRVRAMRGDARISPELGFSAQAVRLHSVLEGSIGGSSADPVHELRWRPGWRAHAGVAVTLGPGDLLVDFGYRSVPTDGVLTGTAGMESLVVGLGFRGTTP